MAAHGERVAEEFAHAVVSPGAGVEEERVDFADVRVALRGERRLIDFDIDDFPDEQGVHPEVGGVDQAAFECERELGNVGCVHEFAAHGGESGDGDFVGVAPRCDAQVVGLADMLLVRDAYGESLALDDGGVGVGRLAQGNVNAGGLGAANAAP